MQAPRRFSPVFETRRGRPLESPRVVATSSKEVQARKTWQSSVAMTRRNTNSRKRERRRKERRRTERRHQADSRAAQAAENERTGDPSDNDTMMMTAWDWCSNTAFSLLQGYARNRGLQPVVISLVPQDEAPHNQCVLVLDETVGVEILRSENHPWPKADASVFARGFHGDFLAVGVAEGETRIQLVPCGGSAMQQLGVEQPSLDQLIGPLPSDARELSAEDRKYAQSAVRRRDQLRNRAQCLHGFSGERCSSPAISSHSVGRAAQLGRIASDGHVLGYSTRTMSFFLGDNERVGRIGTQRASTFRGFCSTHDAELFDAIDGTSMDLSRRTATLLGLRAQAFEYSVQRWSTEWLLETGGTPSAEELLQHVEMLAEPIRRQLLGWRDGVEEKRRWDMAVRSVPQAPMVRFHFLRFEPAPCLVASAYVCPAFDFNSDPLQVLGNPAHAEYLAVSIVPHGHGGLIAFSWLEGPELVGDRLLASLESMPREARLNEVVQWLFANAENIYWSPVWWDELGPQKRRHVERLMDVGVVPWATVTQSHPIVSWELAESIRGW